MVRNTEEGDRESAAIFVGLVHEVVTTGTALEKRIAEREVRSAVAKMEIVAGGLVDEVGAVGVVHGEVDWHDGDRKVREVEGTGVWLGGFCWQKVDEHERYLKSWGSNTPGGDDKEQKTR